MTKIKQAPATVAAATLNRRKLKAEQPQWKQQCHQQHQGQLIVDNTSEQNLLLGLVVVLSPTIDAKQTDQNPIRRPKEATQQPTPHHQRHSNNAKQQPHKQPSHHQTSLVVVDPTIPQSTTTPNTVKETRGAVLRRSATGTQTSC